MGLFEKIFGSKPQQAPVRGDYKLLTGYAPTFASYRGDIYQNNLCRVAIETNAKHISKLKVEFAGRGAEYLRKRLERPNSLQTWSQFLSRLATIYYTDNTAFICPVLDSFNRVTEIYAVLPSRCKTVEVNGDPWLAFEFRDGHIIQTPVWRVGVLRRFAYKNDIFGEDNTAMDSTMDMAAIQTQGVTEAVKSAATYRFMAQMNNFASDEDLADSRAKFNAQNFGRKAGGGVILFPNTWGNIQQVSSHPFVVDDKQLAVLKDNIFDYYGINEAVIQGKAYGDAWTAYYESTVEPFAIQFSEVITAMMILNGELTGAGAQIVASSNRLQYLSNSEKLNVTAQLLDRGIFNRDEAREVWNLPPLPNGEGQAYVIRGEYVNADAQINEGQEDNNDASEE